MATGARRPWAAEGAVGSTQLARPMGHPAGNASPGDTPTCVCLLCCAACEQNRGQEQPPAPGSARSLSVTHVSRSRVPRWWVQLPHWILPQQLGHPVSLERGCWLFNRCV